MRLPAPGSAPRTAARVALAAGVLALSLCAWEVASARSGAGNAQVAAAAAESDAAAAQGVTALQLAELNDVIQPTATSQKQLLALAARTRLAVETLAARVDEGAPAVGVRLRIEAQALDTEIRKLVAATAASDGQAVVDTNARVQRLAANMRVEANRQEQIDAQEADSNLQPLASSRPALIGLFIAALALAVAAVLVFQPRRPSAPPTRLGRAGDQPAARGGP